MFSGDYIFLPLKTIKYLEAHYLISSLQNVFEAFNQVLP